MIKVVPAVPADGPAIGAILSGWIDDTQWMPRVHTRKQDIRHGCWMVDICAVNVVRDTGVVLGFLARQDCDIQALYVHGDYRGQGIGAGLLAVAQTEVPRLGLWSFQCNKGARRFYKRHGFIEDRFTDGAGNDEKLADVHLSWTKVNEEKNE